MSSNDKNNSSSVDVAVTSTLQLKEDDNNELPLPIGMAENISNATEPPKQIGKVELIEDNDGPSLPPAMMGDAFDDSHTKMVAAALRSNQQFVNELSPPTPFNFAEFEDEDDDDALVKKMAKEDLMNQKPAAAEVMPDNYSVYAPSSRQDIEIQESNINRGDGSGNRRGWRDIESQTQPVQTQQGGNITGSSNNNASNDMIQANITTTDMQFIADEGKEDIHIPEAFLVDDISVYDERTIYDATPTLPWWKQTRTKFLLAFVLLLLAVMAIVLGVELNKDRSVTQFVKATASPSISVMPSTSQVPTLSPTSCSYTIATNRIDIDLVHPDSLEPRAAIDGENMVVCSWSKENEFSSSVYIVFYQLSSRGDEWERVNFFIEGGSFGGEQYDVDVSGKTAVIGLKDTVYVYEKNSIGLKRISFTNAILTFCFCKGS